MVCARSPFNGPGLKAWEGASTLTPAILQVVMFYSTARCSVLPSPTLTLVGDVLVLGRHFDFTDRCWQVNHLTRHGFVQSPLRARLGPHQPLACHGFIHGWHGDLAGCGSHIHHATLDRLVHSRNHGFACAWRLIHHLARDSVLYTLESRFLQCRWYCHNACLHKLSVARHFYRANAGGLVDDLMADGLVLSRDLGSRAHSLQCPIQRQQI